MDYSNIDFSTYNTSADPVSSLISFIFGVLVIIGLWKIFTKAGEKGWKSLIPIYNVYILFKISGRKFVPFLVGTILLYVAIIAMIFTGVRHFRH